MFYDETQLETLAAGLNRIHAIAESGESLTPEMENYVSNAVVYVDKALAKHDQYKDLPELTKFKEQFAGGVEAFSWKKTGIAALIMGLIGAIIGVILKLRNKKPEEKQAVTAVANVKQMDSWAEKFEKSQEEYRRKREKVEQEQEEQERKREEERERRRREADREREESDKKFQESLEKIGFKKITDEDRAQAQERNNKAWEEKKAKARNEAKALLNPDVFAKRVLQAGTGSYLRSKDPEKYLQIVSTIVKRGCAFGPKGVNIDKVSEQRDLLFDYLISNTLEPNIRDSLAVVFSKDNIAKVKNIEASTEKALDVFDKIYIPSTLAISNAMTDYISFFKQNRGALSKGEGLNTLQQAYSKLLSEIKKIDPKATQERYHINYSLLRTSFLGTGHDLDDIDNALMTRDGAGNSLKHPYIFYKENAEIVDNIIASIDKIVTDKLPSKAEHTEIKDSLVKLEAAERWLQSVMGSPSDDSYYFVEVETEDDDDEDEDPAEARRKRRRKSKSHLSEEQSDVRWAMTQAGHMITTLKRNCLSGGKSIWTYVAPLQKLRNDYDLVNKEISASRLIFKGLMDGIQELSVTINGAFED